MNRRLRRGAITVGVTLGVALPLGVVGPISAANASSCTPLNSTYSLCVYNNHGPGFKELGVGLRNGESQYLVDFWCDQVDTYLITQTGAFSTTHDLALIAVGKQLCP